MNIEDEKEKQICPICSQNNQCRTQRGGESCWCFSVVFSERLKSSLRKEFPDGGCICKSCFEDRNFEKID